MKKRAKWYLAILLIIAVIVLIFFVFSYSEKRKRTEAVVYHTDKTVEELVTEIYDSLEQKILLAYYQEMSHQVEIERLEKNSQEESGVFADDITSENIPEEDAIPESTVSGDTASEQVAWETEFESTLSGNEMSESTTTESTTSEHAVGEVSVSGNNTSEQLVSESNPIDNPISQYPATESVFENSVPGNTVSENSVSGNTVPENNVSGNTVSGNTVSENTVSENTISGNAVLENTVSENTISGNTVSGNTVSENTLSDNNTEEGETIVEKELSLEERRSLRSSMEETRRVNKQDKKIISLNKIDFSDVKITCLGDSITAGSNLAGEADFETSTYPYQLGQLLGAKEVCNLGIGGSSISRAWDNPFVERYREIPEDSDIILILGGTNDGFAFSREEFGSLEELKPGTFCGDLAELMEGLLKDFPNSQVVFLTPLSNALHDYLRIQNAALLPQSEYANAISQLAKVYGIPVIDLYNSNILDSHDAQIIENYIPDAVHGNKEGYKILAEHIAGWLIQFCETMDRI